VGLVCPDVLSSSAPCTGQQQRQRQRQRQQQQQVQVQLGLGVCRGRCVANVTRLLVLLLALLLLPLMLPGLHRQLSLGRSLCSCRLQEMGGAAIVQQATTNSPGQRAGSRCVAICADMCCWAGMGDQCIPWKCSGRARRHAQLLHPITLLQKSAIGQGTDASLGTDCTYKLMETESYHCAGWRSGAACTVGCLAGMGGRDNVCGQMQDVR
jgi:hypothetical protein